MNFFLTSSYVLKNEKQYFELDEGASVETLLRKLVLAPKEKSLLFDENDIVKENYVVVLVNGENIRYLHGLKTILRDGDRVSVLPPVGGG
jgi:MoaD family protein